MKKKTTRVLVLLREEKSATNIARRLRQAGAFTERNYPNYDVGRTRRVYGGALEKPYDKIFSIILI